MLEILLTFSLLLTSDCGTLRERHNAIRQAMVYEDLVLEAESYIKLTCEKGEVKFFRPADRLLQALEVIISPEHPSGDKIVVSKRLKRSSELLNETRKYARTQAQLFGYQLLFHHIARENYKAGDYKMALKYFKASYHVGKAILEMR